MREIPWWLSGKESTCQCRRRGFKPWSRKTPQTVEQLQGEQQPLSPPGLHPVLCSRRSHLNEKPAHRS